ncbi:metallophosphoesterase family protein [Hymenobacter lucidus]|uniref:Metallophosphoesterase n=1 Tax=Hymenobacter lucidus TaxID=2880930 RepID=A0ABS8AUA3_9BACT|nr:metallophosphoesterase [Hymenobacter lucidus]MCB2409143.1 metallophosphoesterase [Hymenobacter lucidus]
MRIIHLSDIHLSTQNIDSFDQYYINAIVKDLKNLNQQKEIDAICLTGDLIDKGGAFFEPKQDNYEFFMKRFWEPIATQVGVDTHKLFIIPGNHDIDESKIEAIYEKGLSASLKTISDIDAYVIEHSADSRSNINRQDEFKKFENRIYMHRANSFITNFESCHVLDLSIGKIGFACLNTAWRCSSKLPVSDLVFGTVQIRRAAKKLKDAGCEFIIGLMHHPLDFVSEIEKDEAEILLKNLGYDTVLFGHTHHGKSSLNTGNDGSLFISTSRTGFSDALQPIDTFRPGYTVIDFDFDGSKIECYYRKYIHSRNEFDKDVDLARDGYHAFEMKSGDSIKKKEYNLVVNEELSTVDNHKTYALSDGDNADAIYKAIEIYRQESLKLNYSSTVEDFKFIKNIEKEIFNNLAFPLNEKIRNIPALQNKFIESLFERIYTAEEFDSNVLRDIQLVRDDKESYKWYERKLIINSIALSLMSFKKFSPKKVDLLIDFLTDFEKNVWKNALTGLVFSLLYNVNKWERFTNLKERLTSLQHLDKVQSGLYNIEQILRMELYKNNFSYENVYKLPFFNKPSSYFLPFYSKNPILTYALDVNEANVDTDAFEKDMEKTPFLDSYKYALCLAVQNGSLSKRKLKGKAVYNYISKLKIATILHPYQNLVTEYYSYFKYYPLSNISELFTSSLSINETKLKNVILEKSNALEINAEAKMHAKDYKGAISSLLDLLKIDEKNYGGNLKIATCYLSLNKPDAFSALKFLKTVHGVNPDNVRIILKMAECYNVANRENEELGALNDVLKIEPNNRTAILNIGHFYAKKEDWDKAITNLKRGVEFFPKYYNMVYLLAISYYNNADYANAKIYAFKAQPLADEKETVEINSLLNGIYLYFKEYEEAIKYASLAFEADTANAENIMSLGRTLMFGPNADLDKARIYLVRSAAKRQSDMDYGNLGHLELIAGNVSVAFENYKKSLNKFNNVLDFKNSMKRDEHLMIDSGISVDSYHNITEAITADFIAAN